MTLFKNNRAFIIVAIIGLTLAVLLLKIAFIQLFDKTYERRASAITVNQVINYPARGLMYDRNDELIVFNNSVYDMLLTQSHMDPEMDTVLFCQLLNIPKTDFITNEIFRKNRGQYARNLPSIFIKNVSVENYFKLQEHLHAFPGFSGRLRNIRTYPYDIAGHLFGYINEVNQDQIDNSNGRYEIGDYVGETGLEKQYDLDLRGYKGVNYVLKDNLGRSVDQYEEGNYDVEAQSGNDLRLTIDLDLQDFAENLLDGRRGSIVAIEPSTGEILCMATSPNYNPNDLSLNQRRGMMFDSLSRDTLKPFFNRAVAAKYPPGSIIKPVLALIALEEGIITSERFLTCTGAYHYNINRWGCHAGPGTRNVTKAIQQSCNTFFYTIYRELVDQYGFSKPEFGLEKLSIRLAEFGFGSLLHIDLPGESKGLNPSTDYYDELYKENGLWRSTFIISNGIGQGEVELTNLQMANLSAILANRGSYVQPHLVRSLVKDDVEQKLEFKRNELTIKKEHYPPVIDGMEKAISSGTAGLAYVSDLNICGKTGTSENSRGKDHSVFFGFAPRDNPKVAVAVYIEHGGWGGSTAAPIGSLIIEKLIQGDIRPSRKWLVDRMTIKSNSQP